ncbi:MAG: hypothetical protein GY751_00135 [Bacteroidetes bacterium]|nr:hypothetical protein [Bacteroidota bacterium]
MPFVYKISRHILSATLAVFLCISTSNAQDFPSGKIIDTVQCREDPTQSYALYLPSSFDSTRSWPVMFIFDPAARGSLPLKTFMRSAEQFGYILACSNNSRNGPREIVMNAAAAMMQDIRSGYPVNEDRLYTSGFSGGSRAALSIAVTSNKIAGVIGCGAGMSQNPEYQPTESAGFGYVGIVGRKDMNYLEHQDLKTALDELGIRNELVIFEGNHQWPPDEMIFEAFLWLEVMGMEKGIIPADSTVTDLAFQHFRIRVNDLWEDRQSIEARNICLQLEKSLDSHQDINQIHDQRMVIEGSSLYHEQLKNRDVWLKKERSVLSELLSGFSQLHGTRLEVSSSVNPAVKDVDWWRKQIKTLKKGSQKSNAQEKMVHARLLNFVWANMAETAFEYERRSDLEMAKRLTKIWLMAQPGQVWPNWYMAKLYALTGNKKASMDHLEAAYEFGMTERSSIEKVEFTILKEEKRYLELLGKINGD